MIVHNLVDTNVLLPTASGALTGAKVGFNQYDTITFHIVASSVTTGATVAIERSVDGTNWVQVSSDAIAADGVTEQLVKGEVASFYRAVVSGYTDGDYIVKFNAA